MKQAYFVGLDIAKHVFQVFLADEKGRQIENRKLTRGNMVKYFANLSPCIVGMEACGTSNYWARLLESLGHKVRLIQPHRVKAFLGNRNKTDAADARAICEALMHPGTRFVSIKTEEQQDMDHVLGTRERLVGNRTQLMNQIRSYLAERGIILPQGRTKLEHDIRAVLSENWEKFGDKFQIVLTESFEELKELNERIEKLDGMIAKWAKENEAIKKLMTIPGVGPITACAMMAHVGDARRFKNGRQMSAYLGVTPKEHSSGGKQRLLGITKHGSKRIRTLLIIAARAAMTGLSRRKRDASGQPVNLSAFETWILKLKERIGTFKTAVAVANKLARISWAILASDGIFSPTKACGQA